MTYYRRNQKYSALDDLWDDAKNLFSEDKYPLMVHADVLRYSDRLPESVDELKRILKKAVDDANDYPEQAGIVHALPNLIVEILDHIELTDEHSLKEEFPPDKLLKGGLQAVDNAIKLIEKEKETAARFYATKARLLAYAGNFSEAIDLLNQAINFETPEAKDYALRISQYRNYKLWIYTKQQYVKINNMKNDFEKLNEEMHSLTEKHITILGLFTGIIAFIITSIHISAASIKEGSFLGAACLIIILMGALLCAFSGLGLIFQNNHKKTIIRIMIGGIVTIVITLILLALYSFLPEIIEIIAERLSAGKNIP